MATNEIAAAKILHPWSTEALIAKAQRYAEEMRSYSPQEWQYGLFSTFVLEFLARAALAKFSPVLLADSSDWNHVYYGLGGIPKAPKFVARSIDITSAMKRLRDIIPEFTLEEEGFAAKHINPETRSCTPAVHRSTPWTRTGLVRFIRRVKSF